MNLARDSASANLIENRTERGPRKLVTLLWSLLFALVVAGCAPVSTSPVSTSTVDTSGPVADSTEASAVPLYEDWAAIEAAAQNTTVNWFMWGGSDVINTHVDTQIGAPLQEQYGLTLNRVPVENTADAVNRVLNERAAGRITDGAIDLIWINGENFHTMKQGALLYGPFVALLPNTALVDWEDPAVAFDFGVAVDGYESPWASFQFVMEYNSNAIETPPQDFDALRTWILENPGRFTYPAPPNHVGSAFVRQLFYWFAGDVEPFLGPFDDELYAQVAPQVWDYLNEIKPALWRNGETYPELAVMADLLANGEIDFAMEYDAARASNYINQGLYPPHIRTFVFDSGTVANVSYVAIPFNAANPAGAMVVANYLLSPEYQATMSSPDQLGWMVAIDPARLSEDEQAQLAEVELGVATLPPQTLRDAALPEPRAEWVAVMDADWEANVLAAP